MPKASNLNILHKLAYIMQYDPKHILIQKAWKFTFLQQIFEIYNIPVSFTYVQAMG